MRSLWTLVGRTLCRLLQRFETVASPEQAVVKNGFGEREECLGENLGKGSEVCWISGLFQDQIALSQKRFFPAEDSPQEREFPVPFIWRRITQSYSMFTGNVTETTFTSITTSLEELLYFWMDLFFCKNKRRKKSTDSAS